MKKIICPNCGEVQLYYVVEYVNRRLLFNAYGEGQGADEDTCFYAGRAKRCLYCGRRIKVIEAEEDNVNITD